MPDSPLLTTAALRPRTYATVFVLGESLLGGTSLLNIVSDSGIAVAIATERAPIATLALAQRGAVAELAVAARPSPSIAMSVRGPG